MARLFSLHVPAPEKLMLSIVYKLEDAPNVSVSLELSTQDAPLCGVESVTEISGKRLALCTTFIHLCIHYTTEIFNLDIPALSNSVHLLVTI